MALLDWSQCPAVESIPGKVSGAWVFKGTRTPVAIVFENLEDGMTIDEVMDQFPWSKRLERTVGIPFGTANCWTPLKLPGSTCSSRPIEISATNRTSAGGGSRL